MVWLLCSPNIKVVYLSLHAHILIVLFIELYKPKFLAFSSTFCLEAPVQKLQILFVDTLDVIFYFLVF